MLSYTITRNDESLLIKAIDERFNCYKYVISIRDPFVINFCGGTLEMMETLLKDNKDNIVLQELEDEVSFILKKPINLKYKLHKEKLDGGDHGAMILGKISELVERLDVMDKRTQDLEEQLQYGVIIPGYAMGVVPIDTKDLYMTFGKWFTGNSSPQLIAYPSGVIHFESVSQSKKSVNTVCNYQFEGTISPNQVPES